MPAGSIGTGVAVWGKKAAFDVEFTRPSGGLAAIEPDRLTLVKRADA